MTRRQESEAEEWHVALFEVRYDGKHSQAEDSTQFIVHGTRAEIDALRDEIQEKGNWVRWTPESLHTPADVHTEYEWLFESEEPAAEEAEQPEEVVVDMPQEPTSSGGYTRRLIEDRLRTNRDYAARTEKRRDAGHLSADQADALLRYWAQERAEFEAELAELGAVATG